MGDVVYKTKNYSCRYASHANVATCNYEIVNNTNGLVEAKCDSMIEALATTFHMSRELDEIREALSEADPAFYDDDDEDEEESSPVILN